MGPTPPVAIAAPVVTPPMSNFNGGYTYNEGHQRTNQAFTAGNYVDYTCDNIGQLQTAKGKESGGARRGCRNSSATGMMPLGT